MKLLIAMLMLSSLNATADTFSLSIGETKNIAGNTVTCGPIEKSSDLIKVYSCDSSCNGSSTVDKIYPKIELIDEAGAVCFQSAPLEA